MNIISKLMLCILLWLTMNIGHSKGFVLENNSEKLTQTQIASAVNHVIQILKQEYIFPEKALLIELELQRKLALNEFAAVGDWHSFSRSINIAMRKASGDMYLDLVESHTEFVLEHVDNNHVPAATRYGNLREVDILSGNVGYIKLTDLSQRQTIETKIAYALKSLSAVDALIIDLRFAEGGSIYVAQYLMSFFVAENTLLSNVVSGKQRKVTPLRAINTNGNDKFKHHFPIYILQSSFLPSSGEFISYTLQQLEKAVVVGEETIGVGYVMQKQKINEYISLNIPIAKPLHPITNTNWEQTGVIPDLTIAADLSLEAAHKLAKEYLGKF